MARRNTLKLKREGLAVNADVLVEKLEGRDVASPPEVVRRAAGSGERVTRQQYDKATDEPLAEGHGYRWVDESGEPVPSDDVEYYEVVGDEERRVERHEPTLGRGRTLTPTDWVPVATLGEYLVTRTYELWAEEEPDVEQLHELATHVDATMMAPVLPVVLRPSLVESWGILTPQFYEDTFTLLLRVTRSRVEPGHPMPVPGRAEREAEPRHPTQESPFDRR